MTGKQSVPRYTMTAPAGDSAMLLVVNRRLHIRLFILTRGNKKNLHFYLLFCTVVSFSVVCRRSRRWQKWLFLYGNRTKTGKLLLRDRKKSLVFAKKNLIVQYERFQRFYRTALNFVGFYLHYFCNVLIYR